MIEGVIQGIMPNALWAVIKAVFRKNSPGTIDESEDRVLIQKLDSSRLNRPFSSVIANPTDAVVLVRNGEVIDVFTESKLKTQRALDSVRSVIGMGPEVTALKVDLRPFRLEINFGNGAPNRKDFENEIKISDSTGDLISATLSMEIAFHPESAQKALWWSGVDNSVTQLAVQKRIFNPVMSAIQPVVAGSEISNLRTTEASAHFNAEIQSKLEVLTETFGLVIEDISIVWHQSLNEQAATELDQVEFKAQQEKVKSEIRDIKSQGGPYTEIHGNVTNTTNSGMNGIWTVLLIGVVFAGVIAVIWVLANN